VCGCCTFSSSLDPDLPVKLSLSAVAAAVAALVRSAASALFFFVANCNCNFVFGYNELALSCVFNLAARERSTENLRCEREKVGERVGAASPFSLFHLPFSLSLSPSLFLSVSF